MLEEILKLIEQKVNTQRIIIVIYNILEKLEDKEKQYFLNELVDNNIIKTDNKLARDQLYDYFFNDYYVATLYTYSNKFIVENENYYILESLFFDLIMKELDNGKFGVEYKEYNNNKIKNLKEFTNL